MPRNRELTSETVNEAILGLMNGGYLHRHGQVPSRTDYERWRLEVVKDGITTSLSCSRTGEYRARFSGRPLDSQTVIAFGWISGEESCLHLSPPYTDQDSCFTDRKCMINGSIPTDASVYVPSRTFGIEPLLNPNVEAVLGYILRELSDPAVYQCWKYFLTPFELVMPRMARDAILLESLEASPAAQFSRRAPSQRRRLFGLF